MFHDKTAKQIFKIKKRETNTLIMLNTTLGVGFELTTTTTVEQSSRHICVEDDVTGVSQLELGWSNQ